MFYENVDHVSSLNRKFMFTIWGSGTFMIARNFRPDKHQITVSILLPLFPEVKKVTFRFSFYALQDTILSFKTLAT